MHLCIRMGMPCAYRAPYPVARSACTAAGCRAGGGGARRARRSAPARKQRPYQPHGARATGHVEERAALMAAGTQQLRGKLGEWVVPRHPRDANGRRLEWRADWRVDGHGMCMCMAVDGRRPRCALIPPVQSCARGGRLGGWHVHGMCIARGRRLGGWRRRLSGRWRRAEHVAADPLDQRHDALLVLRRHGQPVAAVGATAAAGGRRTHLVVCGDARRIRLLQQR